MYCLMVLFLLPTIYRTFVSRQYRGMFYLVLMHMLEIIRTGIENIDKEEVVTDLSSVQPFTDSQVEQIEMERVMNSRFDQN